MVERRTVEYCEARVLELESLGEEGWRQFQGHRKFREFMDEYLTWKCVTDLWWFVQYGVYFRAMNHYDPILHGEVCRWLQDWTRLRHGMREPVRVKWLIMARSLCKSQLMLARLAWKFVRDPNASCLIRAYIDPKAEELSSSLQEIILSAPFQRRFPWVRPATKKGSNQYALWRPDVFNLEREIAGLRVPSVQALGVDGEPTGGHFDFTLYDDFEVGTNAKSAPLRKKMLQTWKDDNNLHNPGSERSCAGTPWSPLAMVHGILNRVNGFEDHEYDVFVMPIWQQHFETDFVCNSPVLLGDRRTLLQPAAAFPTAMGDLQTCQVRVAFHPPEMKDVVEEVRECVWNDGEHVRVNRPFPELLGAPVRFVVGKEKPSCPVRHTMDAVDYVPQLTMDNGQLTIEKNAIEVPPIVLRRLGQPGVMTLNKRDSLPQKEKEEGPTVFVPQNLLKAASEKTRLWNVDRITIIREADIPPGVRKYYRSVDFAGYNQKTNEPSSTAFTTAFTHDIGLVLCHIRVQEQMSSNAKLLEWVLGALRVRKWGFRLLDTTLEESSNIEKTLLEFMTQAEKDPYAYFERLGDQRPFEEGLTYKQYAERELKEAGRVPVSKKWIPRKASKKDRIEQTSPVVEDGRIYVLDTCENLDEFFRQAENCTADAKESFDILDNVADLVAEYLRPRKKVEEEREAEAGVNVWAKAQKAAMERMAAGNAANPGWK